MRIEAHPEDKDEPRNILKKEQFSNFLSQSNHITHNQWKYSRYIKFHQTFLRPSTIVCLWEKSIQHILTTIFYSFYLSLQCFLLRLTDILNIYILIISLSFGPFNSEAHFTIIFWMFVTDCQAACIKVKFSMYTEPMHTFLTQHMPSVVPALAAAFKEPYTTIKALKHYTLHIHWENIHHPDYIISTC